jgi:hypothetical protein
MRFLFRRSERVWLSGEEIVTGERLQALADISLIPVEIRSYHRHVERYVREMAVFEDYAQLDESELVRISSKRSLFVYTHALDGFIEHVWPQLSGDGYVLITHNSDHEVGESRLGWIAAAGSKLRAWFAQNVTAAHPKLVPLPIGIANSMWEHGNLRTLHREMTMGGPEAKTDLVYLGFNTKTHPERQRVWEKLRAGLRDLPTEPPPATDFRAYAAELARHRFCVCPRGNGIDTHRFWEALYLKTIPIVERSLHTEHWQACGLPVVVVDDWQDVTPGRLTAEAGRLASRPATLETLRLSRYARLVHEAVSGSRDGVG